MVEIRKSEAEAMKRKYEDQAFCRVQTAFAFSFHFPFVEQQTEKIET